MVTIFVFCFYLATLILNWNEDGMIYRKKAGYKEAVAKNKSGEKIQVNQMVAPSHLNPYIRGLRLSFVLLFCFIDIGYALYLVSIKYIDIYRSNNRNKIRIKQCHYFNIVP